MYFEDGGRQYENKMDKLGEVRQGREVEKRHGKKLISLKSHYISQVYQQRVAMTGSRNRSNV